MDYIGKGIYSIPDVHRITGLPNRVIYRWVRGYDYTYNGETQHANKLWETDFDLIDNQISLSFKDLIEIKFVNAFKKYGLGINTIRNSLLIAQERFGTNHPFSTMNFLTDGRKIFLAVEGERGEKILEEISKRQIVFNQIVSPFLKQLEFENDILLRWWPLTKSKSVVLDPNRNFGQPIVKNEGILTEILSNAVHANDSFDVVMDWYNVSRKSLEDALEYESQLAA